MHIVYGLGNPGGEYQGQRHNVGRMLVDQLAGDLSIAFGNDRDGVRFGEGQYRTADLVLAFPTTYMNNSGTGFKKLRQYFDVSPERILVVLDDLDLEQGALRLRPSGSDGGHRGMRSILNTVDSRDVPRLRIGIGRPPTGVSPSQYVLGRLTGDEREVLEQTLDDGVSAVKKWVSDGITPAMNAFNS